MPIAAPLIIGAASVGSSLIGANAAKSASDAQVNAENNALAAQNAARAKLDPWINVGTGANYTLGSLYGIGKDGTSTPANADYSAFTNSPDYAFAQQQGELGLTRAENARGLNLSGGALKDISQFNQGLATQQFGNYFNRLMSLSQLGQSAAGQGVQGANAAAQTMGNIGQSQASGIIGGANAITGGINSGISNSLLYNAINRSSYSPPGASSITQGFGNIGGTGGNLGGLF